LRGEWAVLLSGRLGQRRHGKNSLNKEAEL
jgi:hypothetical protein